MRWFTTISDQQMFSLAKHQAAAVFFERRGLISKLVRSPSNDQSRDCRTEDGKRRFRVPRRSDAAKIFNDPPT